MAFKTKATRSTTGEIIDVYNVDQSVGPGARGNFPVDIMLVQALFRIVHFEVDPVDFAPPPGEKGIAVDGILGRSTAKFISNWQQRLRSDGVKILLDGIFDPYRSQGELSHIAHVRYAFEILNIHSFNACEEQGRDNFRKLPSRADIPPALQSALRQPTKLIADKYAA